MGFVRVVKNSNDLENSFDIPKELRNKKVEVIILPYTDTDNDTDREESLKTEKRNLRGSLSKYRNEDLHAQESYAWSKAVVDKHENN